jgi:hypothetical protein
LQWELRLVDCPLGVSLGVVVAVVVGSSSAAASSLSSE